MSQALSIARLVTRCRAPRRLGVDAARVDRLARTALALACARELDALSAPGLCRINRLTVRLTITPDDLAESRLPALWASALARSLREAMSRPDGPGPAGLEIVRSPGRGAWLARWIADAVSGRAGSRWEYDEFRPLEPLGPAGAAVAALLAEPRAIAAALVSLEHRGELDRFLALLGEEPAERLIAAASTCVEPAASASCVGDVAAVARVLVTSVAPIRRGGVADRRLALRVFALLASTTGQPVPETPRRVFHALSVLALLAEKAAGLDLLAALDRALATADGAPPHPTVAGLLLSLRDLARRPSGMGLPRPLEDVANALDRLVPQPPSASVREAPWVESEVAGLFLLVEPLERLGWPRRWRTGPLAAEHGERALPSLLTGLALAVLGRFPAGLGRLDPGLALFAGIFGDPDVGALRRFFESRPPAGVSSGGEGAGGVGGWAEELDALAGVLVRAFAGQIRGFRESSRAFLVARLIATPGRVRVEEGRLLVRLAPNPLHVALHVSGADYPVGPLGWYGDRTVEFELEGLR